MPESNNKFITEEMFFWTPQQLIDWLKAKGFKISYSWRDIEKDVHARYYSVAKAMKLDILQDFYDGTLEGIENGRTVKEFQKNLEPILRSKGWWGKQDMVNPKTGETETVQLGSPYRLKTIYTVNSQVLYQSGRYAFQIENVNDRPYFMYLAVRDNNSRPTHKEMHGVIMRYDDPFWIEGYPPNGWYCRCRVRALSEEEVKALGLKIEDGKTYMKIIKIDEGWNYNPGKSYINLDPKKYNKDLFKQYQKDKE